MIRRANHVQRTFEAPVSTLNVVRELIEERDAQDDRWGGPAHDDLHDPQEWLKYIDGCSTKAAAALLTSPFADDLAYRHELLQVAALAIAAVESLDRKLADV